VRALRTSDLRATSVEFVHNCTATRARIATAAHVPSPRVQWRHRRRAIAAERDDRLHARSNLSRMSVPFPTTHARVRTSGDRVAPRVPAICEGVVACHDRVDFDGSASVFSLHTGDAVPSRPPLPPSSGIEAADESRTPVGMNAYPPALLAVVLAVSLSAINRSSLLMLGKGMKPSASREQVTHTHTPHTHTLTFTAGFAFRVDVTRRRTACAARTGLSC
jgi:hypothetical protein